MTAIRPPGFPPTAHAATPARPDVARTAAQKAFFQAALSRAQAPQASVAPAAAQAPRAAAAAPAAPAQTAVSKAEPPAKILRPGSLIDIKV